MSELTTAAALATESPAGALATQAAPPTWLAQVMQSTFGRVGARLGLIWIAVVGLVAILAPFLANSNPLLLKMDGRWSSPLIERLTSADVTLLLTGAVALVLWPVRSIRFSRKLLILLGVAAITLVLSLCLLHPPRLEVYQQYREAQASGHVQWMLRTPVPYSPDDLLRDQFQAGHPHPWAPSASHLLGTDSNAADILSHMIHACRIAMAIGFIATGISIVIGIVLGGLMGYFAGAVDLFGMRLAEVFGSIPTIYLLLAFVAVFERNIYLIMAIIGLTSWVGDARFVRAEFLKLRQQDFVQAAIAAGLPLRSILFRHLLPNALAPLLVSASFGVASAILTESTLSFLGLGLPPGAASWGRLLNQAVSAGGGFYWWLAMFPGLAIFLTVFAYNLIGESLRDALDPRLRGIE